MDEILQQEECIEQSESKEDNRTFNFVFCPDVILNCTAAGFVMALLTIVCIEVGIILAQRVQ